jgi:hypothetical protein
MEPPKSTEGEACVVRVGAAMAEVVVAEELSFSGFGSVEELTVAMFSYSVPAGVPAGICPVRTKVLVVPAGKVEFVQ